MKKRNRNYFGFIDIADGVGKPISSEIAIEYHGNNPKKEKMAKKLHKAISRCLTDSGRLVAQYNALGMSYDGEQYYAKEGENDIDTKAHEEWHSEVYKQGYTIHPAYSEAGLSMLDESSAYAVGNYTNLLIGDKPKQAHEEIEYQKDFCSEGIELYENVLEGQEAGNIPQELIEDIIDFQKEYPLMKMLNGPNWATFLCQMSNLGLYEPCITILEEYGSDIGKEIILDSFEVAVRKRSLDGAADCLGAFLPKEKQNSLISHYEPMCVIPSGEEVAIENFKFSVYGDEDYLYEVIGDVLKEIFLDADYLKEWINPKGNNP